MFAFAAEYNTETLVSAGDRGKKGQIRGDSLVAEAVAFATVSREMAVTP